MRILAWCTFVAFCALATVATARLAGVKQHEPDKRAALGCAVRVAGLEAVRVAPRQAVILIDEVLVIGEIKPSSRHRPSALAIAEPVEDAPNEPQAQALSTPIQK